jgi:hypothetical protein
MEQDPSDVAAQASVDDQNAELVANAQPAPDLDTNWIHDPVLDKSQPYGENSEQFTPKRFCQNGHWFTAKGVYVKE